MGVEWKSKWGVLFEGVFVGFILKYLDPELFESAFVFLKVYFDFLLI